MLASASQEARFKSAVLLYALMEIAAETVLYSWQLTGLEVHQYISGQVLPANVASALFATSGESVNGNGLYFEQALSLISSMTGTHANTYFLYQRRFNVGRTVDINILPNHGPWLFWHDRSKLREHWLCIDEWIVT